MVSLVERFQFWLGLVVFWQAQVPSQVLFGNSSTVSEEGN